MKKNDPILVPDLYEMLAVGDSKALRAFCESEHPATIAEFISLLSVEDIWDLLRYAGALLRSQIFTHLDEDLQQKIIGSLRRDEIARLLAEMSPDDRTDLFKQLPEGMGESILPALAQAEREDIRRLSSYEEGTAGASMTSDYATLAPELTVYQAIERLREIAPDSETIYYAYVLDEARKLIGSVSLKDLIVAPRWTRVSDIMQSKVISVRVDDDQESAARKIQKYDVIALPVLNQDDALVGIITYDDAMDIITKEQTEDMEKFMAIVGTRDHLSYMKTTVWGHFRNRYPWVIALAVLGMLSGFIVQSFEDLLMQFTVLMVFMPMLADTGGNTGSQSATLVVRALALNEITWKDGFRILAREFRVSLLLAVLLGALAFGRAYFFSGASSMSGSVSLVRLSSVIALALGLQVITSTLVGALLPLGADKMKWDPAVVASPALTTIVDITGLLIYFTLARWLLGI